MNPKATYKLSYGVYLLSAREGKKDNACIINTAVQVASKPTRISVAVIKANHTHDMIAATGIFNISALTENAPMELFQRFGMQSGRDTDKFAGFDAVSRSENGLYYLNDYSNAFMSVKVTDCIDLGSHSLFIGELVDGEVLGSEPSCTYNYYQTVIKSSAPKPTAKKGWKCKICGYVYEGDTLPEDYLCPLCKHGPEDFEYFEEVPAAAPAAKKWECSVCKYVHEGAEPPERCPLCNVPASMFSEI